MSSRVEARLERVKRTSRSARRACLWLMVLVALVGAVTAFARLSLPEAEMPAGWAWTCEAGGFRAPCDELGPQVTTVFLVALLGGVALALTALYRLARLFGNYSRGEIFTRASVAEIRLIGYVLAAGAVLQLVLFVAVLAVRADGGTEWPIELRFDLPIVPVLVASLVMLLSWVMDVGAEMREENELTV